VFATETGADGPIAGGRVLRITDPSGPSIKWAVESIALPSLAPDFTIACTALDGDYLVAVAVDGAGDGRLVRWVTAFAAVGDLDEREWWDGSGWVVERTLAGTPPVVLPRAGRDGSLIYDSYMVAWVYVTAGRRTIDYRVAA